MIGSLVIAVLACWLSTTLACELAPERRVSNIPKSPGDNHYKILISGDPERYVPGEGYVVTIVGSRTHDQLQLFKGFKLVVDPLDHTLPRERVGPQFQGRFELFADTLTKFDDRCINTVVEADDLEKSEVQVQWRAPPSGSGCVNIKAMVLENQNTWFAEDGQLTKRMCEEVSKPSNECCACDEAKYKMVFQGIWSPETHPKDFPTTLWLTHFSDVIGATHVTNFSFWGEGEISSDGFRSLAEWGSVGLLERELRQQGGTLRSIVKAAGLWHPRVTANTSALFTADRKRHLLSLASMFGPSPDWVVGVSGLDLCQKDCTWKEALTIDLTPYDAGTDNGITYMSPNSETAPRERIYRITPMYPEDPRAPFYNPEAETIPPLARLYLTREQLVPRSCDDELLQQLVAEVAENTETVERPECAVEEWSAWSACSVSCGKGLRMRTRKYRMPQKASMLGCDRQLVSKEMCVADIPECEQAGPTEDVNTFDAGIEDNSGICGTTEWGPWDACSVSCGVGINIRRRQFVNRMGPKKCPLVPLEDQRKCMQPACPEGAEEQESGDPSCPTTPWSTWSPCSSSCGRGMRLRTRLLLVQPNLQQLCASRVELVQQQPCVEREDCSVDMATAKQICMEEADPGPCRGVFQRWTFMAQKGMCVPFVYFGCRGNRNNFLTQEDCMSTCRVVAEAIFGNAASNQQIPNPAVANSSPVQGSSLFAPIAGRTGNFQDNNSFAPPAQFPRQNQIPSSGVSEADCRMTPWSGWSQCSVSCGTGYQERIRSILAEAQPGGVECPTRLTRRRRCHRAC